MRTYWLSLTLPVCLVATAFAMSADADLARSYAEQIHPLMVKTCGGCHGAEPKDNDLDLAGFATSQSLLARPAVVEHVIERLHTGDMPPREAPQPSDAEREQLLGWFSSALDAEAAGDPAGRQTEDRRGLGEGEAGARRVEGRERRRGSLRAESCDAPRRGEVVEPRLRALCVRQLGH